MRKAFVPVLAVISVLSLASLSMAAEKTAPKNAGHRMVGEVVSVDVTARSLTIKETVKGGEAKEVTFNLDEKVRVMVAGKMAKIEDLKPGDSVTVHYTEKDGNRVASSLNVAKPPAAHASKSK